MRPRTGSGRSIDEAGVAGTSEGSSGAASGASDGPARGSSLPSCGAEAGASPGASAGTCGSTGILTSSVGRRLELTTMRMSTPISTATSRPITTAHGDWRVEIKASIGSLSPMDALHRKPECGITTLGLRRLLRGGMTPVGAPTAAIKAFTHAAGDRLQPINARQAVSVEVCAPRVSILKE